MASDQFSFNPFVTIEVRKIHKKFKHSSSGDKAFKFAPINTKWQLQAIVHIGGKRECHDAMRGT